MRFLAVHPNSELYGSDRSFAAAITAVETGIPGAEVTCVLPQKGTILTLPPFRRVQMLFESMWIPRRGQITPATMFGFLARGTDRILHALRTMRRYDLVYINTIISLNYIVATILSSRKSIIHVREIPTGRELAFFRRLLLLSNSYLIFNSRATQDAFRLTPAKAAKAFVVYNGTDTPPPREKAAVDDGRKIRLLVIGRLNSWKGQELLVAAIASLAAEQRAALEVRIVGSVFSDMDRFRERLIDRIAAARLEDVVTMAPFADDPSGEYIWADLVVVPSTRPEPFGRVAIEAMSHKAAVIAAAHGGLTEIVVDGMTGWLVAPSNVERLAEGIARYIAQPALLRTHGEAGYQRFVEHFTNEAVGTALVQVIERIAAS